MRITIENIRQSLGLSETYDIVNAIRNSSSDQFQSYVPLAHAENVAEIGAGITVNQAVLNEFITSLVDRIGLVVLEDVSLKNHLKKFKKGAMPQGRKIEQIFTDIAKEHNYDAEEAEETLFRREIPNVKTLFHERNRQGFYKQTIQDDSLKTAFVSWGSFGDFVASIINAMYNSAEVDEYKYMKLIVDNYYSKGLFKVEKIVKPDTETAIKEFVKKARAIAEKMTLPTGSRNYNALAVRTRTELDDLHILIDADLKANMDVDVLASAFNMNKTEFLGHVTVIDGFASTGLEAVMIDKGWYMVYDNLIKMETVRNAQGLYWNYFYHIWQTLSASRFHNAVAFVSDPDVAPVTNVIVDPAVASIKAGKTMEFTSYVWETEEGDYPLTWSVSANDNSTMVEAGTTIDENGVLTVDPAQTGDLFIEATVTYDIEGTGADGIEGNADDTASVVGEAIVNVVPA